MCRISTFNIPLAENELLDHLNHSRIYSYVSHSFHTEYEMNTNWILIVINKRTFICYARNSQKFAILWAGKGQKTLVVGPGLINLIVCLGVLILFRECAPSIRGKSCLSVCLFQLASDHLLAELQSSSNQSRVSFNARDISVGEVTQVTPRSEMLHTG